MSYTLVCCKNDERGRTGLIYKTEHIPEYAQDEEKYATSVVPQASERFLDYLRTLAPTQMMKYVSESYTLDVTSIDADYKRFKLEGILNMRNRKLLECDWTQTLDAPLSDEDKESWRQYRQALRDIPTTITFDGYEPSEVVWPTPPN